MADVTKHTYICFVCVYIYFFVCIYVCVRVCVCVPVCVCVFLLASVYSNSLPILKLTYTVVSVLCSLYILDTNSLSKE